MIAGLIASPASAQWNNLGAGMNNRVNALAFDSAGNLYAGGSFTTAGGNTANRIAKWVSPEIDLSQGATPVANSGSHDFGS